MLSICANKSLFFLKKTLFETSENFLLDQNQIPKRLFKCMSFVNIPFPLNNFTKIKSFESSFLSWKTAKENNKSSFNMYQGDKEIFCSWILLFIREKLLKANIQFIWRFNQPDFVHKNQQKLLIKFSYKIIWLINWVNSHNISWHFLSFNLNCFLPFLSHR